MGRRLPDQHALASNKQLWRLNEQGLLRVALDDDTFVPGGPAEWPAPISAADANKLLARLQDERWSGGRFPEPADMWSVVDGRVVIHGPVDEPTR